MAQHLQDDPTRRMADWRRWLGVVLRSAHLVGVSALAVALHGAAIAVAPAAQAMAGTGALLLALELADGRLRLNEAAGLLVLGKLAGSAAMALRPDWAPWIFWPLVFISSLGSHAPRRWRHWPSRSA